MNFRKLSAIAAVAATVLGVSMPAQSQIVADIMWVVDTSGSMGDDINQVKQRIAEFDAIMLGAGVDARYGLVRYGGNPVLIQDFTSYATFIAGGGPFSTLSANGGGTEDGSLALQTALTGTYRAGSVRNLILITDEDDEVPLCPVAKSALGRLVAAAAARGGAGVLPIEDPEAVSFAFRRAVVRARARYEEDCASAGSTCDPGFMVGIRLHDLRHHSLSEWARTGALSLFDLLKVSGHKSPRMLARYINLDSAQVAAKMATMSQ